MMPRSLLMAAVMTTLLSACTSFYPVALEHETLQTRIRAGELFEPGDRIRVTTAKSGTRSLTVVSFDELMIVGKQESVPIDDIIGLETRDFSPTKTTLLASGLTAYLVAAAIAVSAVAFLP